MTLRTSPCFMCLNQTKGYLILLAYIPVPSGITRTVRMDTYYIFLCNESSFSFCLAVATSARPHHPYENIHINSITCCFRVKDERIGRGRKVPGNKGYQDELAKGKGMGSLLLLSIDECFSCVGLYSHAHTHTVAHQV